jgi:hexosaminidase
MLVFFGKKTEIKHSIIPAPLHISLKENCFHLKKLTLFCEDSLVGSNISLILPYISQKTGLSFEVVNDVSYAQILLLPTDSVTHESYTIDIHAHIDIIAGSAAGFQYALYTLSGLIQRTPSGYAVPCGHIHDNPTYAWRGLHIDVARHFFDISVLFSLVEDIAYYKLNTLHLHLTDDQGWRFESLLYPKLHTVGAYRDETVVGKNFLPFSSFYIGDKKKYGSYYTQADLRRLDQFARDRGVQIVPEIDIPGHATAALVAYPEYSAGAAPDKVATYWGVFDNLFSPNQQSVLFLKNIVRELGTVFSSPYIHIGGDEVPTQKYKDDNESQRLLSEGKIKQIDEIPNYILEEVAKDMSTYGKKAVLWDEAQDVSLNQGGVSMIWRDMTHAKDVLEKGGTVILTLASHMYFDYYQKIDPKEPLAIGGFLPIEQVYSFKAPFHEKGTVLGIQANLWTEYISTPEHMKYMLFPRLLALSEVAWGTNDSLVDFMTRTKTHNII